MPIAIDKPSKYFNTITYTGTGSSQSITGVGFKPDLVYGKSRSSGTLPPTLVDAVRGSNLNLYSNQTRAEENNAQIITSFNSDGFSVGTDTVLNSNGATFVAWNWLASNTTVSNTAGTITSTVSANTTSGFSIVSYTGNGTAGATVGHGLGVAPSFIIIKNRSISNYWGIYHKSITASNILVLNATDASASSDLWNYTTPTSSVFSIGNVGPNASGNSIIAYCFAEVKGFSKAFKYTGNGSSDGTYVHLGFRPAFVIAKQSSAAGNDWTIYDNKRNDYNVVNKVLYPNASGAEATASNTYDFLSNGFKLRTTDARENGSGSTYIGFAIAENPFVSSKGVPVCAR